MKTLNNLRTQAERSMVKFSELENTAKLLWPTWKNHEAEFYIYETSPGFGPMRHATFGFLGYEDAALCLSVLRKAPRLPELEYDLWLIVNDDAHHFALINCENGKVFYSEGFPRKEAA